MTTNSKSATSMYFKPRSSVRDESLELANHATTASMMGNPASKISAHRTGWNEVPVTGQYRVQSGELGAGGASLAASHLPKHAHQRRRREAESLGALEELARQLRISPYRLGNALR